MSFYFRDQSFGSFHFITCSIQPFVNYEIPSPIPNSLFKILNHFQIQGIFPISAPPPNKVGNLFMIFFYIQGSNLHCF